MTSADIIVEGARVRSMAPADGRDDVRSIAVADGRVIGVGDRSEIAAAFGGAATRMEDLAGTVVTPGLIDAHLHPIQGVELTQGVDLGGILDLREILEMLRAEAGRVRRESTDGWVRAWNLDYAAFAGAPLRAELIDEAVDGLPALLFFFDFHTALASTAGLRRGGVVGPRSFDDTSEIVVDPTGRPTGELREDSAYQPLLETMPDLSRDETLEAARATLARMRRSGLTGGAIMDGNSATLDLLEALDGSGSGLPVRIVSAMDVKPSATADERAAIAAQRDRGGARWRAGLIKLYADGVIDTGAGWLYEPDVDGAGLAGFWGEQAAFVDAVQEFTRAGFQIATHAIGDRAVGETITAYETVGSRAAGRAPHRIEHLECLDPSDIVRLVASGITASMQLPHMQWRIPDGSDEWSRRLGPERAARGWNAGSVVRAGAPLALGSDWPIADLDARLGLAWSVLRRTPRDPGAHVYEPEERLSMAEALHGYTRGAALAQGDADLGVIREGSRADFAVWAADPVTATGDEILDLPVLATYLDGIRADHAV